MNVNEDDNINYDFNAYSFETFFYDLITALFDNKKYDDVMYKIDMPWYNTKMEKRVERIMLFIVIDIAKKTIFQRDLNIIKKEIINPTEINKYNIKIQDLNEDMIKLNKILQDIVNLCNGNINDIQNTNAQFISLNTLLENNLGFYMIFYKGLNINFKYSILTYKTSTYTSKSTYEIMNQNAQGVSLNLNPLYQLNAFQIGLSYYFNTSTP
jgi:hypothetical protein